MHQLLRIPLCLLAICLIAGTAGAAIIETRGGGAAGGATDGWALTQAVETVSVDVGESFELAGEVTYVSSGLPVVGATIILQEQSSDGSWLGVGSATTDANGEYSFTQTKSAPGVIRYRTLVNGQALNDGWSVTVGSGVTTAPSTAPTTVPTPVITTIPGGATYAQAREYYVAAAGAWSQAWGASEIGLIRQYLNQAKSAYTNSLNTASQTTDPANAANLALVKSVSTAYMALADAALAMYDGADVYGTGRSQMNGGNYAAAAASFQTAGEKFASSQTLFGQATTTLQSVSYAGTEYGDGTAYTAVIVPILNAKATYMGEFAAYARGWQHTALAYQASVSGDQATFRSEATQAMNLFGGLRTSPSFGADATANYNVLAGMLSQTVTVTTTPTTPPTTVTTTATPVPIATSGQISSPKDSSSLNQMTISNERPAEGTYYRMASSAHSYTGYINPGDSVTITGVYPGTYTVYVQAGTGWNAATQTFANLVSVGFLAEPDGHIRTADFPSPPNGLIGTVTLNTGDGNSILV